METEYSPTARRLGLFASAATALLILAYALTLVTGFLLRSTPDETIRDPMFSILELLIIALVPAMIAMVVAVHAWCPRGLKALGVVSVVFMVMLGVVTSGLHFFILIVSRQPEFTSLPWFPLVVEFRWPSVAYLLDILAWDVFFPISMLFAAPVFRGGGLEGWIRRSMILSALLALGGLSGIPGGNMGLRNIGIVGYVGVFLAVAVLLFLLFHRSRPHTDAR